MGAIVQGIGGALFEAIIFSDGSIRNARFSDYRVPRFSDAPNVEIVLIDRKDIPSAGAGETPIVAVANYRSNMILAQPRVSPFRQRATASLPVAGAAELREGPGRAGQPSAVSLGHRTRHNARRDSSPCAFDFPIQPSAPIYGTSSTPGKEVALTAAQALLQGTRPPHSHRAI